MTRSGERTQWQKRSRSAGLFAAVVFLALTASGCQLPSRIKLTKTGSPQYDRANIVYRLDGGLRPLPLTDAEIKAVSFEDAVSAKPSVTAVNSEWSTATLSVQYPHPDGTPDLARATLRLSAVPAGESGYSISHASRWLGRAQATEPSLNGDPAKPPLRDDEIWVLDLPRQELDLLVTDLQKNGFFQAQTRAETGTNLDVRLDYGRVNKQWSAEPRLDQFISRVYQEGQLGGLVACNTPDFQSEYHSGALAGR